MREKIIKELLAQFWEWARISESEYRCGWNSVLEEPFCFPKFDELIDLCLCSLDAGLPQEEMDVFLMCMALDDEAETILDACKEVNDTAVLARLVNAGVHFQQPKARWQMAELLRCRNVSNRKVYLERLLCDEDSYVRKRAQNTLCYLKEIGEAV